jgi:hypothetical protein
VADYQTMGNRNPISVLSTGLTCHTKNCWEGMWIRCEIFAGSMIIGKFGK